MKQLSLILIIALTLGACTNTVNDEDKIRNKIQTYKQQVYDLNQKISELEQELSDYVVEEAINVIGTTLSLQNFEHFIELTGEVEAEMDIDVSPESSGIIEEIYVIEGQIVNEGQKLAKLRTDALQKSLDEFEVQLDLAQTTYERQKNLWDQNIGSEIQYLQAKTNLESLEKRVESINTQIEMANVKAPVSGVVDIIYQKEGQFGNPQFPFAKVVNISKLKIYGDISETYISKINPNSKVEISFPALGINMESPITRTGNIIDPNNRTFRIRIDIDNQDQKIKPNMVSILKIRDYQNENAIVIPSLQIKEDFNGAYTYIAENRDGSDYAKKVYVTTGVTDNNITEITEGLEEGMTIISEGFDQISDGTLINLH